MNPYHCVAEAMFNICQNSFYINTVLLYMYFFFKCSVNFSDKFGIPTTTSTVYNHMSNDKAINCIVWCTKSNDTHKKKALRDFWNMDSLFMNLLDTSKRESIMYLQHTQSNHSSHPDSPN